MKKTFLLTAIASLLAAQVLAGQQITMKSTFEGDAQSGGSKESQSARNNVVRMTADGDKARIDFVEGQMPGASEDGYLVTRDAGKTFYMVSPKEKTYMKWDTEAMMGMAGAVGGMMKMEISDPRVEKLLDEAGPAILGLPTRHYKFRTSYRMSMSVMGFKNETSISKEDEAWTTTKLDLSAMNSWVNKLPKTQNPELDKLIAAEKGKMTGIPLKMVSVQSTTDNRGKTTVSRTGMEVTDIRGAASVATDIPADYQEIDLFQGLAGQQKEESPAPPSKRSMPKINFGNLMKQAMESAE